MIRSRFTAAPPSCNPLWGARWVCGQVAKLPDRTIMVRAMACTWLVAGLLVPHSARAATFTISGVVQDEAGSGVANVDVDLIEYCTRNNVFLVNDNTLSNGAYSIVVNEGTYDIHFTPPAGTLAASEIKNVVIDSDINFGVTILPAGLVVAGVVRDESEIGVATADVVFFSSTTGNKIFVPNDETDPTGAYSVLVPAGTYDIKYRPPPTTDLVTGVREGLVVSSDVTGLIDVLPVGLEVFGTVVDSENQAAIEDADLDLKDTCTGQKISLAHDDSDLSGNLSVYVPASSYTIHITPPRCTPLGPYRLIDQPIDAAFDLGMIELPPAFPVTGRVLDDAGQPVINADLDFLDAGTGVLQFTVRDNTDESGNFSVFVRGGLYDIRVQPPETSSLLVGLVVSVIVEGATDVGDIDLAAGIPVFGTVLGPDGTGVLNVDVDVRDSASNVSIRVTNDDTLEDGSFGPVVVPAGTYDFRFIPLDCVPLAPARIKDVAVNAPLTLPPVNLVEGVHASGFVLDSENMSPVEGVDLDFFVAGTGVKEFTTADNTDFIGFYDVVVPVGDHDINYVPPVGSTLVAAQRFDVALPVDTALPDTILEQGFVVSGFVYSDATGLPVPDTDLDFVVPGGGATLFTPRDETDLNGFYTVVVAGGPWDIAYEPPAASGLATLWMPNVLVASDLVLPDTFLLPLCGNGIVDPQNGETCDPPGTPAGGNGNLCGPDCTVCGDGTVDPGEQCDDRNGIDNDACRNDCTVGLTVTSIDPASGTTAEGQPVTVTGTGFHPDATFQLGGMTASAVTVLSPSSLTATTPAHPPGLTDVVVTNPGGLVGTLPMGYLFQEPASPVFLSLSRSGNDIELNWTSTGQASYTVLRHTAPTGFSDLSILIHTSATSYTDAGGALGPSIQYYGVY